MDVEKAIRRTLIAGAALSVCMLLAGLALHVLFGQALGTTLTPRVAARQLLDLRANGFASVGVLVLIITPFARVLVSCQAFLRGREWRFAAATVVVLALIVTNLLMNGR